MFVTLIVVFYSYLRYFPQSSTTLTSIVVVGVYCARAVINNKSKWPENCTFVDTMRFPFWGCNVNDALRVIIRPIPFGFNSVGDKTEFGVCHVTKPMGNRGCWYKKRTVSNNNTPQLQLKQPSRKGTFRSIQNAKLIQLKQPLST